MHHFTKMFAFFLLLNCFAANADKQVHQHSSLEIPANMPTPGIEIRVERDPVDGLNVLLNIENYLMNSPVDEKENAKVLQGHAHVFVNGQKRQRLYGHAIHIPNEWLKKGVNQIAFSLNSHDHDNWMKDGKSIVGSVFVDLAKEELVLHHFTSQPVENSHHGMHH